MNITPHLIAAQPMLVNENVTNIPKINPMKELYWRQFGGSPTPADLKRVSPEKSTDGNAAPEPRKKRKAKE